MAILIEVKVVPASGKQACVLEETGIIKCFLKSPPVKGKANIELVKLISQKLKIPQYQVKIVSGGVSRRKKVKIDQDITFEQFCEKLSIKGE